MAILLRFEKVREDSREVEYAFGPEKMDRRLLIEKASRQGRPIDQSSDQQFAAVFVKILRFHRTEGTWPERGAYSA